jgi:hypothetical protein
MGAGNLEAWSVTPSDFPATATLLDKARFAVRYAILAPSSHNTQPWRFVSGGRELLICADRTRSLPNIDPFDRELIISCGAALFNLRVALAHFLIPVEITTFPYGAEPDVVARIAFPDSGPALKELADLFSAITARATIDTAGSKGCDLIVMASHAATASPRSSLAARRSRYSRIPGSRY